MASLFLHFTPFSTKTGLKGRLLFQLADSAQLDSVLTVIKNYCSDFADVEVTARGSGRYDYEYFIELNLKVENTDFLNELQKIESIGRVRISFKNIQEDN